MTVLQYRVHQELKRAQVFPRPAYEQTIPASRTGVDVVFAIVALTPFYARAETGKRDYLREDFGKLLAEAISLGLLGCH